MNMRMAFLDMTMVEATSTPPPIRPPAMGTSLPRLIAPFWVKGQNVCLARRVAGLDLAFLNAD